MYSNELMNYLYCYNMPQKDGENKENEDKKHADNGKKVLSTLEKFKSIYATVPVKFNHE